MNKVEHCVACGASSWRSPNWYKEHTCGKESPLATKSDRTELTPEERKERRATECQEIKDARQRIWNAKKSYVRAKRAGKSMEYCWGILDGM